VSDLRGLLGNAALRLSVAGIESPRLDARLLLAHAVQVRSDALIGSIDITPEALTRFESFLARRILHEPVAYIIGKREFWSLEFEVGPGVLIPRPETETLIEQVIEAFPDRSMAFCFVDLGVGSACLLAACLSEYPNARGIGIDSSERALSWAGRNIGKLGFSDRSRVELGPWDAISAPLADVILSNPPYIRSEDIPLLAQDVRLFEPLSALDGGEDGLDAYRALAPLIERVLKPEGLVFLEIGHGQDEEVPAILEAQGLQTVAVIPDLAGIRRCVTARRNPQNPKKNEKTVGTTAQNR
jgi:release factor glutamine methyltransferase